MQTERGVHMGNIVVGAIVVLLIAVLIWYSVTHWGK